MEWPFVSRRRYNAVNTDRERLRGERDQFLKDRNAFKFTAESATEKYTDTAIVNEILTDELTKAREELAEVRAKLAASMDAESALARQIHELAQPVEPTDDEMDAINVLIQERDSEKKRADGLQEQVAAATERADLLQAELDDARLVASRLTALVESRQRTDDQHRPVDGAALVRREPTSARLRRERALNRRLEEIVRELQASHVADTRELHDLRQNRAAS